MASSLRYTLHHYGSDHELQRLGVWDLDVADKSKYWVIYIHGGAWRDPRITHEAFTPTIDHVLSSSSSSSSEPSSPVPKSKIAAFASLDYRLSRHPQFPQDPDATPPREYRDARHPDHVRDVLAGLAFLQRRYGFDSRYVLLSHSAGACLALQVIMSAAPPGPSSSSGPFYFSSQEEEESQKVTLPRCVVGLEGIYDFTGLNARMGGAYAGFFGAAFGKPALWDDAAPRWFRGSYKEVWDLGNGGSVGDEKKAEENEGEKEKTRPVVLIAQSHQDSLVDEPEADHIAERLAKDEVDVRLLKGNWGDHDVIWEDGTQISRLIGSVLEEVA
ncbi:alpha/beta-hydrolase [Xylariomycetidae sp. FL2044]|nr:alpha/beta-hydrolase [Xylariomycetidae sp. FL2044]